MRRTGGRCSSSSRRWTGPARTGAIKHVLRGLDPKATQVFSFKVPSQEELKHDFMWRCLKSLPERGRIGIFNRSYYEEVLVSRVHPELLEQRQLPAGCVTPQIWRERFEDIRDIERYLTRNGTLSARSSSTSRRPSSGAAS
jgi:polyphosphate kinase 2 (PPK2 family)